MKKFTLQLIIAFSFAFATVDSRMSVQRNPIPIVQLMSAPPFQFGHKRTVKRRYQKV